jgi:membrane protein DedA with SNARE-associated domain
MPESIYTLISGEIIELGGVGIFLSFLLFGEVVIFAAAMLIHEGVFSVYEVFFFSMAAVLFVDIFWYSCGKFFPKKRIPVLVREAMFRRSKKVFAIFETTDKARLLIPMKFFIGIRIAYMLYLAQETVPIKRLVFYEAIGVFVFVISIIALGYYAGNVVEHYFYESRYIVMFALGLIFVSINAVVSKLFFKSNNSPLIE